MIEEKDVRVAVRDGVRIALRIYRPDGAGPFPTLFAASPYRYDNNELPAYPLFLWRETGPIPWYVEQGYAFVHMDVRGSGFSEGEFGFMDRAEQEDLPEIIEWIAAQSVVERQGRRHRAVVLLHAAMVHGHPEPAAPRLPRRLRRPQRSVSLHGLSGRHRGHVHPVLVQRQRTRVELLSGQQAAPARDGERPHPRVAAPPVLRRLVEGAHRVRAARQDQDPALLDRVLGQAGSAPAGQHPRLPARHGAEEARDERHRDRGLIADGFQHGRVPQEAPAAVLRSLPQGAEDRLPEPAERRVSGAQHRRGARASTRGRRPA